MATPDVRVRLSAEGVAEVVSALKAVQTQAQKTAAESGKGFGVLNNVLSSAKGWIGGLAAYFGARELLNFAKDAAEAADRMGKLGQEIGTTTTKASALVYEAQKSGVGLEGFQTGAAQFGRRLQELREGIPGTIDLFGRLGLSAKSFSGMDVGDAIGLVADKMSKLETGGLKSAVAVQLFGRSGQQLIPMLNDVGSRGLPAVIKAAQDLGVVISDETAEKIDQMQGQLATLKMQAQGLAAQFVTGLAPSLVTSLEQISSALKGNGNAFKEWGENAGKVLPGLVAFFGILETLIEGVIDLAGTGLGELIGNLAAIKDQAVAFFKFDGDAMMASREAWKKTFDETEAAANKRDDERVKRIKGYWALLKVEAPPTEAAGAAGAPTTSGAGEDQQATLRARLELRKAQLQHELELAKANAKLLEAEEKSKFDRGLEFAREYYDNLKKISGDELKAELKNLDARKAVAEQMPEDQQGSRAKELAQIAADRAKLLLDAKEKGIQLDDQERSGLIEAGNKRIAIEQKIRELRGQSGRMTAAEIEVQIHKATEELVQAGVTGQELQDRIKALRDGLQAESDYNKVLADRKALMADLDQARSDIEAKVKTGQITELQGQRDIAAAERARLPELQKIAQAALKAAEATGDAEKIRQAQDFVQSLQGIGVALTELSQKLLSFREDVRNALTDDLSTWFDEGIKKGETFKSAMKSLADSVVASLKKIASQILALWITQKLTGFLKGGTSSYPKDFTGPIPLVKADGGLIQGPGTGTSDSIFVRLSNGEFVMRAAAVKQPGALGFLRWMNATAPSNVPGANERMSPWALATPELNPDYLTASPRSIRRAARMADGGLVGSLSGMDFAPSGGGSRSLSEHFLNVSLSEGLVIDHLKSSAGQQATLLNMAKNRRAIRAVLGV